MSQLLTHVRSRLSLTTLCAVLLLSGCAKSDHLEKQLWSQQSHCAIGSADEKGCPNVVPLDVPGPEDVDIDFSQGETRPRLIISSHDRRDKSKPGRFYQAGMNGENLKELSTPNLPQGSVLRPHGIHVVKQRIDDQDQWMLYAVNHPNGTGANKHHEIMAFFIRDDELIFSETQSFMETEATERPYLIQPNDVFGTKAGALYVTNMSDEKRFIIGLAKSLAGADIGNVLYIAPVRNGGRQAKVLTTKVSYPNGIVWLGERDGRHVVIVSQTRRNKIIRLTHRLDADEGVSEQKDLYTIVGGDNFSIPPENTNTVLLAAHPSIFKFLMHRLISTRSPTKAYEFHVDFLLEDKSDSKESAHIVFEEDGKNFNAGSTVLRYNGKTYFGKVFDAGISRFE